MNGVRTVMRSLLHTMGQQKDGEGAATLSAAQKTYLEKCVMVRHTETAGPLTAQVMHLEKSHPS